MIYVTFVACQSNYKITHIILLLHFCGPIANTLETALISKVIANQCSNCISIIHTNKASESVWTTSIPNMHFNNCTILDSHILLHISTTYCYIVIFAESILAITLSDTWFSNSWITKENYFGFNYGLGLYNILILILETHCLLFLSILSILRAHWEDLILLKFGLLLFATTASLFLVSLLIW